MNSKCTIVTFYFNLKNLEDTNIATRPPSFYLDNGKHTLQINNPMVIFCDSVTKPLIQEIREKLTDSQTIYIEKNITDYDHYKMNYLTIKENRNNLGTYQSKDNRSTASYLLVTTFKIQALKIAKDRNDFNSTHFIWMDFGCGHVVYKPVIEDVERVLLNPRPKITCLYIHYRSPKFLENMIDAVNKGICGIAGTFFSVEKSYIDKLYTTFQSIFYEMLSKKIGHNEEQVLTYIYDRYPELFTLYYGDYYSTICNYHKTIRDQGAVKEFFINNALNANREDLANQALISFV
jgi:hypothetical protein